MKTYYDNRLQQFHTQDGLRQRGLPLDDAVLSRIDIYPVRYMYPAYDQRLYTIEPKAVTIEDGTAWQEFEIVPVSLEVGKKALLDMVATARHKAIDDGFMHDGILWDSDANARIAYAELAMRYQYDPAFVTTWKASDGYWVEMTAPLFQAVHAAGAEHVQTCFAWQAAKEEEIRACESVEELEAVVITYA